MAISLYNYSIQPDYNKIILIIIIYNYLNYFNFLTTCSKLNISITTVLLKL